MRRTGCLMLVLVLFFSFGVAFADEYEKPILFRNTPWGSTYSDTIKSLPSNVDMKWFTVSYYPSWHAIDTYMYNHGHGFVSRADYNEDIGCKVESHKMENVKIAGYEVYQMGMYFAWTLGDDGKLIQHATNTALIFAYYGFIVPTETDRVYTDLKNKLTSLYGDIDSHQSDRLYEQYLWNGSEGTMVSLVKYSDNSIYINYGFRGADDLMKTAYDALLLEAEGNTDGL